MEKSVESKEQQTISVVEAGRRYLSLGKDASYQAARNGQMPGVIRIGKKLRVSVRVLERLMEDPDAFKAEAH